MIYKSMSNAFRERKNDGSFPNKVWEIIVDGCAPEFTPQWENAYDAMMHRGVYAGTRWITIREHVRKWVD